MINKKLLFGIIITILLSILPSFAYKVDPPDEVVHQHITNESQDVWPFIPNEIKDHLVKSIRDTNVGAFYTKSNNDDIITGSVEEDYLPLGRPLTHFWNPDSTTVINNIAYYDDGLFFFKSSYRKALELWTTEVIPLYLKGEKDEAYWWLGRIAHLLEDAAQPSHVHLDPHLGHGAPSGASVIEDYTADNFNSLRTTYNWTGSNFAGQQYNYDNLIENFDWSNIDPNNPLDKRNIELFRLFWYTAQKTQYWASDNKIANYSYIDRDGNNNNWDCSGSGILNLWADEGFTSCSDFISSGLDESNVDKETNAVIPHSMKAVAGLYKLFDDAVRIDWPTENHDFRRTGFTLLKGDLATKEDAENQINLVLDDNTGTEQVVKPTVSDLDGNSFMDSVVLVHKTSFNQFTRMYGMETQKIKLPYWNRPYYRTRQKWPVQQIDGGAIWFPASLGNIGSDSRKEIVTGTRNGTIYAYDVASNGKISEKWAYYLEERFSPLPEEDVVHFNGGTAIVDIDLDGTNEIVFADVASSILEDDWDGKVYVLDGSGSTPVNETSVIVGNGGTYASISVANIDSDDEPEIIVPTKYGIKVYDYSSNDLTLKCSNSHGLIESSAIIYDVDEDNEYELIYVTSDRACASGKTCLNRLYILNASSCTIELGKTFTEMPRPTPTVANLDSDSQSEIIVSSVSSLSTGLGTITVVDSNSGTTQWTYDNGGNLHPGFVSPNIADIDNDGSYNIVLGENNGNTVYVLDEDGNEVYKYTVSGFMDNGLAIADIDSDQLAEIVFKRAGSPTLFTSVSNENFPPELNTISNITAIAGNLININASGEVSAVDIENDNIEFFYSSPFNGSGLWQTNINDTGNYSILVEASDGNLSTYKFVDVIVLNETAKSVTSFADGSINKTLNYSQAGNLSVTIRLPRNATVIYSKIKMQGAGS